MAVPGIPIGVLLVLLFVLGTLSAIAGGARNALLRSTVEDAAYVPARSLMKLAAQIAQIAGNAIGGGLVVLAGTSGAILINAASFALALVVVRFGVGDHGWRGRASGPRGFSPDSGSMVPARSSGARPSRGCCCSAG